MNTREYLLIKLAEECSEVAQACSKALLFGLDDVYEGVETNLHKILREFKEAETVLSMLGTVVNTSKILLSDEFQAIDIEKRKKVIKWMDYSRKVNTLD